MEALGTDIFLNTQFQKDRRFEMLKGIRHSSCASCWLTEEAGIQSLRTENRWFPDPWRKKGNPSRFFRSFTDDSVLRNAVTQEELTPRSATNSSSIIRSERPHMLELNLGNSCDLRCSYCGPDFSSKWEKETELWSIGSGVSAPEKLKKELDPRFEALFWKWFQEEPIRSLSRIGIIGGEPFINPRLPEVLDRLLASYEDLPLAERPHSGYLDEDGKVLEDHKPLIWFVTNMNLPEKVMERLTGELLPKLVRIFHVEIHASLESTDKKSEYSRQGLSWENFQRNTERLCAMKLPGFTFGFQAAINVLSVSSLSDFLRYAWSLHQRFDRPILLKQNIVSNPQNHHPAILTQDFAAYVQDALEFLETVKDQMPPVADERRNWSSYYEFLKTIHDSIQGEYGSRITWGQGSLQNVRRNFFEFFRRYDERHGTDFLATFPEYTEFYELCRRA